MLLYDIIPGASIGVTKILIGYPFETLKNRIQLSKGYKYDKHGSI